MKKEQKGYITIGIPGSGKSFAAIKLCKEQPNLVRINKDLIRREIFAEKGEEPSWKHTKEMEPEVNRRQSLYIREAFKDGHDVIVDNMHIGRWSQQKIIKFLTDTGFVGIKILDFRDVPLGVCLERNAKRTGFDYINPTVITNLYTEHIEGKDMSDRQPLPNWVENHLPNCCIFDIDGNLADCGGIRSPYDETNVYLDNIRNHILFLLKMTLQSPNVTHVFIFSGRTNNCRRETERWLIEKCNLINNGDWTLHMRKIGDMRPDSIIKTELYNECVLEKFNTIFVADDRSSVIEHCWKKLNIPVLRTGLIGADNF